jgi:hypothetical protein
MANATGAFGLRPVRHKNGMPWNGATVPKYCSASYDTAMFIGQPVERSLVNANMDATGHYDSVEVSAGTDGTITAGVIVAFDPYPQNLELQYRIASTERIAHCCVDPTVIYQIRGDGGGTPIDNWVGYGANMVATAGSTTTGLSGYTLDEGTAAGPDQNQSFTMIIEGLANIEDNELGDNALWEVTLNTYLTATGLVLALSTTS